MDRISKIHSKIHKTKNILKFHRSLKNLTLIISGGSRGIGLAVAKIAARDGANIVILGKTDKPHPKLPGTIYTAAREVIELGGRALPLRCGVRNE